MRTGYILAMILALIFTMGASCSSNRAEQSVEAPFAGGIEGLTAEFIEIGSVSDTGAQNEVWEDEYFPVEISLMNKGEYTVGAHDVELEIKGITTKYASARPETNRMIDRGR